MSSKSTKSALLAEQINNVGAFCFFEVNGIQHQFKLNIDDLSPGSPVYRSNRAHIRNTEYTLIPDNFARRILRIGKRLFDDLQEVHIGELHRSDSIDHDYLKTSHGRFIAISSIPKLSRNTERLEKEMRQEAKLRFGERYNEYYRQAFVTAYEFFSRKNDEFREQLNILKSPDIELFWKEVVEIYKDLQELQNVFRNANKQRKLTIKDLDGPDQKTAYKLWRIPMSFEKYVDSVGYSIEYLGVHGLDLRHLVENEETLVVDSFLDACRILGGVTANNNQNQEDDFGE